MTTEEPTQSARDIYAENLKHQRKLHKLSQEQLAHDVHCSPSWISAFELKSRTPSRAVSRLLDKRFGLPILFEALQVRIVEETGLPQGFTEYTALEPDASMVMLYQAMAVPGMFQIPGYARAILTVGRPDRVETLLAARRERQELLDREDPPFVTALIDEYALHRWFGDAHVMKEQYERLLELMRNPMVSILLVPGDSGLCLEASFNILELREGEDDDRPAAVGYVESISGQGQLYEARQQVIEMKVLFELIRNKAMTEAATEKTIRDLIAAVDKKIIDLPEEQP